MPKKNLFSNSLRLAVLTMASRLLGLAREMIKGALLGTSALADAFTIAFVIPNLLRRLFAEGSVAVAFVPTYKSCLMDEEGTKNRKSTRDFLNSFFTVLVFLVTATTVLGVIITPLIVRIMTGEFDSETVLLTWIMFPYLVFISLAALLQGILNSRHYFMPTGFTPILFNICIIGCGLTLGKILENPARAMAVGVLAGGFLQMAFQYPFVKKAGESLQFRTLKKSFSHSGVKRVFLLIGPTILGMAAYQLNNAVSTSLARHIGRGISSSLQYSLRLQELILGVVAVSIGTVLLSELSELAQKKEWESFRDQLVRAVALTLFVTIPLSVFVFVNSSEIVSLLFQLREFDAKSVELTAGALRFHILGTAFIAVNRVISPAFYAVGDTKTPTKAGVGSVVVNIILAFSLAFSLMGKGIALAVSIASAFNTLALFLFLGRKIKEVGNRLFLRTSLFIVKYLLFSILSVLPYLYFKHNYSETLFGELSKFDLFALLFGGGLAFILIYLLLLSILKDKVAVQLLKLRRKRG